MERHQRGRCQRPQTSSSRQLNEFKENERSADVCHRPQPYQPGFAQSTRFRLRPRRAARRPRVKLTKRVYGWPEDAQFLIPDSVVENFRQNVGQRRRGCIQAWEALFKDYSAKYPELAEQLKRMEKRELPPGWDKDWPTFPVDAKGLGTRESSGKVINAIAKNVPIFIGGSADLSPSTKTRLDKIPDFQPDNYAGGRNLPLRRARACHGRDSQWPGRFPRSAPSAPAF